MAEQILMPRQGNTVESCIVLEWKKHEGDSVSQGDVLCEVETDKATFEVESTSDGTLLKTFFEEGDDVPVLTPIAVVGNEGEDISDLGPEGEAPASAAGASASGAEQGSTAGASQGTAAAEAQGSGTGADGIAISPRARHRADKHGIAYGDLAGKGTGPGGRIIERDVEQALSATQPLTPAAAAERARSGMQAPVEGTGIGGRVRARDLAGVGAAGGVAGDAGAGAAGAAAGATAAAAGGAGAAGGAATGEGAAAATGLRAGTRELPEFPGPFEDVQVSGVRKIIAERMHASLSNTAQLTMHSTADARSILSYRKKLKASREELGLTGVTINDIVLYGAIRTLVRYPALNAHFNGESIRRFGHVHAGFAVDTDRGLMVPVVKFADALTLRELAAETKRLSRACQESKIDADELQGGTFTVTNLGALGIEMFTPVLNVPEVAILGVCSIEPKPVQTEEGVELHPHIGLSLTINHQGVDGAPGARFLNDLVSMLADFDLLLAG